MNVEQLKKNEIKSTSECSWQWKSKMLVLKPWSQLTYVAIYIT